jgi:hypothetical protein
MDVNFYQQLCEEENILISEIEEKQEDLKAIRLVKARYEKKSIKYRQTQLNIIPVPLQKENKTKSNKPKLKFSFPLAYDVDLNQFQKTYIALYQLGRGFSTDIAEKLQQISPKEFDSDKAYKVAREKASDLYQHGIFGIEKYGRKYKYFIKDKE